MNEIFSFLNDCIKVTLPEGWSEAKLYIEVLLMFSSYNGIYLVNGKKQDISVFDFPIETGDYLIDLHMASTKGGINKWNRAIYTLYPDNQFKIEYIWDAEYQAEVDKYNQEAMEEDPSYEAPKWHWEE